MMHGREPTQLEKEMVLAICNLQDEVYELKQRVRILKQINSRYMRLYGPLPLLIGEGKQPSQPERQKGT